MATRRKGRLRIKFAVISERGEERQGGNFAVFSGRQGRLSINHAVITVIIVCGWAWEHSVN